MTTDANGKFVFDQVEKGTTYRIRQTAASGNYRITLPEHTVAVDAYGYMDGEPETVVESTNRLLRVQIGITDEFSDIQIPGLNLALYTGRDELVYTWTSSGNAMSIDSLEPGGYYLIKSGDKDTRYDIRVRDTAEIQTINLRDSYIVHYRGGLYPGCRSAGRPHRSEHTQEQEKETVRPSQSERIKR